MSDSVRGCEFGELGIDRCRMGCPGLVETLKAGSYLFLYLFTLRHDQSGEFANTRVIRLITQAIRS